MTIKFRLLLSLGLLLAALLAVAVSGWVALGISNTGLATVYHDRVVPLRDLKVVSDMYAVNVVDTAHKVRNGSQKWQDGTASVEAARKAIAARWQAYAATAMNGEEERLAAQVKPLMTKADTAVDRLQDLLRKQDHDGLDAFVIREMYDVIDPVTDRIGKLVDLQLDVARQEYDRADASFHTSRMVMGIAVMFGLGAAVMAVLTTLFRVIGPLGDMTHAMTQVAAGDLNTDVPALGSRDEMGEMAAALATFKDNVAERRHLQAEQKAQEERHAAERRQAMLRLADDFEGRVGDVVIHIASTAQQLSSTASTMSAAAEQASRQAAAAAAAAR
ncbi:MAG TPA: MCP four helix bundle domain-containing protein, partial [Azospirillaceae bacterium]|nr:MCP four helix bundle domain-containing protein [Azospirillaceae bacterium]